VVAFAIAADSSTDVWAFGLSNVTGGPVALHFNGSTWAVIPAANSRFGFRVGGLAALSPTNVWAAGAQADSDHDATVPAAEHWDGASWSLVPVPNPNPTTTFNIGLSGIAAISANDIWAVGSFPVIGGEQTLTEHWDGTSWSIIASPNPGKAANSLDGVTALADGTVVAVGQQVSSNNATGLILQNAASKPPKGATKAPAIIGAFAIAGTASAPLAVPVTGVETLAAPTATMPAIPRDAVPVDPLLAAVAKPLQSLSFVGPGSGHTKRPRCGMWISYLRTSGFSMGLSPCSGLTLEDSAMAHWWTIKSRREGKKTRTLRAPLHLEPLEQRNLLSGLVFVPSPQASNAELVGAAAISASDIWAVGGQSSAGFTQAPLAEHFDGTSWSVVSTPSPTSGSVPAITGRRANP
jgi:hypothetical protein